MCLRVPVWLYGLSPRPWGTLAPREEVELVVRFIPTPVGNTVSPSATSAASSVYPHACGEPEPALPLPGRFRGLSPHVWGTHVRCGLPGSSRRFIPTRVGNPLTRTPSRSKRPVYPHTCGEPSVLRVSPKTPSGLSPHVWGTQHLLQPKRELLRFIPTRVGNPSRHRPLPRSRPVYPHTCGEPVSTGPSMVSRHGLSPHVWGTRNLVRATVHGVAVYPHTCGEPYDGDGGVCHIPGLSPHVWGTQLLQRLTQQRKRFIPTRVGNPSASSRSIFTARGLSPHVWGTPA